MDESYYKDLRDIHGELKPITLSMLEKAISEFYMSKEDFKDEETEFYVYPLTDEQVEEVISNPESPYHKILPGYMYKVYSRGTVCTGRGGAQMIYKAMLGQGMTEEMIMNSIYVHMDDGNEYPLSLLTVKKK